MKNLFFYLLTFLSIYTVNAQEIPFQKVDISATEAIALQMNELAKAYINSEGKLEGSDQYRINILAGNYDKAIAQIKTLREENGGISNHPYGICYEVYIKAKQLQKEKEIAFEIAYQKVFLEYLNNCEDDLALTANYAFTTYDNVVQFTNTFNSEYEKLTSSSLNTEQALSLLKDYFLYRVFSQTETIIFREVKADQKRKYIFMDTLITSSIDGAEIDVTVVRKRENTTPLPAILNFTIYADSVNINDAILPATKGYVGVLATSRGKRRSSNKIHPYVHEHKDVYAVIDWISKQPWNTQEVGMFGGSYNGFTQWASMKNKVHPALKTIVPSVTAAPGIDVPRENNIFFNFPYKWISYVTENKYLFHTSPQRWNDLNTNWYASGVAYNKMDSIDGTPNPLFQEWISHPTYDDYWQNMIPYKEEFAHINIPILTTTGFYDDAQRGALYYYREHMKYNPNAEHYVLIGPYDHWGAQSTPTTNLRGYALDEVARIDIKNKLIFEWYDYILKGAEKPALLKDKVNFQVMNTNKWVHRSSLESMSDDTIPFYLNTQKEGEVYTLGNTPQSTKQEHLLQIDLADRSTQKNANYYPWPIAKDSVDLKDGLVFISKAFAEDKIINGAFSGELIVSTNKKDFDYSVLLYELTSEGKYFHLSYHIGRASHTHSMEKRTLLTPHQPTPITFNDTRIISKLMKKGSKMVIVITGNKNPNAQINYGTGKDVSTESIADADELLILKISSESWVNIPVLREVD